MKLKDILELGTYGYNPDCKVDIFDMANFEKRLKLDTNAHSVFSLHYHLILVVKYRRPVFTDEVSERAKEIFEYIAPKYKIELLEWNHNKDHVHILFKGQPMTEMSKFINAYK